MFRYAKNLQQDNLSGGFLFMLGSCCEMVRDLI